MGLIDQPRIQTMRIEPGSATIYFLFLGDVLQYVGKSHTFFSRIGAHLSTKDFDRVSSIYVPKCHVDAFEIAFIKHFRPPLNKTKHPPITPEESRLIAEYTNQEAFISSRLLTGDTPDEGQYGAVAFYILGDLIVSPEEGGTLTFGLYDDDTDEEECEDDCAYPDLMVSLNKMYSNDVPIEIFERAIEQCQCPSMAIVYADGHRGYFVADRADLIKLRKVHGPAEKEFLKARVVSTLESGFGFKFDQNVFEEKGEKA